MTDKPTKRPNEPNATGRWENEGGAPRSGDISEQRAHAKRHRDPQQLAKHIIDIAAGDIRDAREPNGKDPAAVEQGGKAG
jgi:hypothetical protein